MKKSFAAILAFGAVALASSAALAQDAGLPAEGNFVISGERLFGFHSYKGTAEYSDQGVTVKGTQSGTQFSLLWGANGTGGDFDSNPDSIPRAAFDYFVTDMISIGGSLGYYSASGERELEVPGQSASEDLPDISGFVLAPRVGFMIPISDSVGFWPRAGFTYFSFKTEDTNSEVTNTIQQVNLEGMFFISPVSNFGFILGPVVDLGIGGKQEYKEEGVSAPDIDLKWTNFGGVVGLGGFL